LDADRVGCRVKLGRAELQPGRAAKTYDEHAVLPEYELFHGGDRSRQRMSSEVKRAEEGNDDLVNHPLQKIKCRSNAH
jgi:hypothetical protein